MPTDERAYWDALEVRRPGDVPAATPLAWQLAKHTVHNDRLMNRALPADSPHEVERGDAGDALAVLALRESIRQDIEHGRGVRIREALELGATWAEVAAALDMPERETRTLLRTWANGQRALWLRHEAKGVQPFGLDAAEHAAVLALCGRDTETPAAETPDGYEVRESTRRYAEELRSTPGKASADGHTDWECTAGASYIADAMTPGPGRLGTIHAAIYTCPGHRAATEELIASAGYTPDVRDTPPDHRWDPWPCGHLTAFKREALTALCGAPAPARQ
ncbi:hypothetical protein [Streptomyces cinereoruber]|uniref:hypothetical protein n=1 Tax=Streptomyces cinereoruber TaxID=67260 RepID=UPI0036409AB6